MQKREFGRSSEQVSAICLGGWHIGAPDEEADAIRLMHAAIDEGITFFDNAWDYHDGKSEERMGKALAMDGKRSQVFLMSKNCERDYAGSMKCLEDSLRRLQTDHLDLWQFHECNYDNDPDWIFSRGGVEAAVEARRQGKVRYIGFTGHKDPRIHLDMLSRDFAWDACQMPINVMDAQYRSFLRQVVPVCEKRGIAVIGMKGYGGGHPAGAFEKMGLTAEECYRFALSQPVATQVLGMSLMEQLRENARIGKDFQPMSAAEQKAFGERVREVATDGRLEQFKSTTNFDGPHHKTQHGFV
jgi:aryl-alcohol dehydrogenase-like predicted oxidoreductase